ncbi:MAG TPA: hypothetical protein VGX50_19415, partial [Longimicrobium sp.]|nr:hypothetical protein [Longimicrobium sp.]
MPKFRMKDLAADLPAGGVHAHQAGGCIGCTLRCTAPFTYAAQAEAACGGFSHAPTIPTWCEFTWAPQAQAAAAACGCTQLATACGGCSQITNPCLGCTHAITVTCGGCTQLATVCGGCSHITNPCLGCTHAITVPCGGCSHITNPCLGCTQVVSICGGCSHITNPCIGCTGSPTFVEQACGIVSRCLPWTIGPVCHGGFTHHPRLGPDPAQHLATLKEQLRAQLRQIEEAESGLPSDPSQAAELEDRLQNALDRLREHRTRLQEEGGDDNRESGGA